MNVSWYIYVVYIGYFSKHNLRICTSCFVALLFWLARVANQLFNQSLCKCPGISLVFHLCPSEMLAWASAQIHCQFHASESRVALPAQGNKQDVQAESDTVLIPSRGQWEEEKVESEK